MLHQQLDLADAASKRWLVRILVHRDDDYIDNDDDDDDDNNNNNDTNTNTNTGTDNDHNRLIAYILN